MENTRTQYNAVAMSLHWITALLMIFMVTFGEDLMGEGNEAGEAAEGAVNGTFLPSIHVSIGITILILTILRLVWRIKNPPPPYPDTVKTWEILLSRITHALFYVLLIGLPFTGWLAFAEFLKEEPGMSAVSVYGLFPLPVAPAIGEFVKGVHALGSNAAIALIGLHVLAALKHQFIDGDTIFRRMIPH